MNHYNVSQSYKFYVSSGITGDAGTDFLPKKSSKIHQFVRSFFSAAMCWSWFSWSCSFC